MNNRSIIIRKKSCDWGKHKVKRKAKKARNMRPAGFVNPFVGIIIFAFFAGFFYLYSINQSAVKGVQIRRVESEIKEISNQNEMLKIKEAELKSLYEIEKITDELEMSEIEDVSYIEYSDSVAVNSEK